MKRAYYYLFYKFYKVTMTGAIESMASWYAAAGVVALECFLLLSSYNYYAVFFDRYAELNLVSFKVLFPLALIMIINHVAFSNDEKLQDYIDEFDRLSKEKNKTGAWIVSIMTIAIVANLVFSYYLMSQIDWSIYRK